MHKQERLWGLIPCENAYDVCWDLGLGLCCLVCGPLGGVIDGLPGLSAERPR